MSRAKRPLNREAVKKADAEFHAKHPELKGKPLSGSDPKQAGLRKEWMALYKKNSGRIEKPKSKPSKKCKGAKVKCPPKTILSIKEANKIFKEMANQKDIAFRYPTDGCYARAHIMAKRMKKIGINSDKVWSFASSSSDPLWVNTPNHPSGKVKWGYHVAPTVKVKDSGGNVKDMVIDPSMFDKPVTVKEWKDAQHDNPTIIKTAPGEPPIPARGGSGYWPGEDPLEGIDAHSEDTMEDYKFLEGT